METIKKYLQNTEFAVKSQLDIMKNYEKENFNTLAKLLSKIKTKTIEDMNSFKNKFDLNIYDDKNIYKYFSYSILNILGWTYLSSEDPYSIYKKDMEHLF